MARIRAQDTAPEIHLRRLLHRGGFRYRLHQRSLPGRPDLVLARYDAAVFVHGCFWHRHTGCAIAYEPKSRTDFWTRKFQENIARDKRQMKALREAGWRIAVIWECGLRDPTERKVTAAAVMTWLKSDQPSLELPVRAGRGHTRTSRRKNKH